MAQELQVVKASLQRSHDYPGVIGPDQPPKDKDLSNQAKKKMGNMDQYGTQELPPKN